MSVFLQPIYTQTVGAGGASVINFANIPQGFTDLAVYISARSTFAAGDAIYMRVGDTSGVNANSIYFTLRTYNSQGTKGSDSWGPTTQTLQFMGIPGAGNTANFFSNDWIYLKDYSTAKVKNLLVDYASPSFTSGTNIELGWMGGNINLRSPISRLQFGLFNGGNFVQNTTITVYGISATYDTATPAAPTIGAVTDLAGNISVAFTANDTGLGQTADNYYVTSPTVSITNYGTKSPIVATGLALNTAAEFNANAVNSVGTSTSANSASITTYNNYASIASVTLSGTASSIAFNDIPQYYKHLHVRISARGTNPSISALSYMAIDGQSTGNARYGAGVTGPTTSAGAYVNSAQPLFIDIPCANSSSGQYGVALIDIIDYSTTNLYKQAKAYSGINSNGSYEIFQALHQMTQAKPTTSLVFYAWGAGTFAANTTITLYGVS